MKFYLPINLFTSQQGVLFFFTLWCSNGSSHEKVNRTKTQVLPLGGRETILRSMM